MDRTNPADTLRNNDVVITSKRRHFDVITPKWLCFDVITTFKGKCRIRLYPEVHGIFVTSNERHGVSNQLQVFFSRFRLATKIHNYHWPFVRGIQRWQVDPPLKGQKCGKLFHVLTSSWLAGDLLNKVRYHRQRGLNTSLTDTLLSKMATELSF